LKLILPPHFPPGRTDDTLLDAESFIEAYTKMTIENELDIANEIFLVGECNAIHYSDLMPTVPEMTSSKSRLLAWLNDHTRHDKVVRKGIVTLYKKDRHLHFDGTDWRARYFCEYIEYVGKKLLDVDYVGKERAMEFAYSLRDGEWLNMMLSVCGLYLLNDLHQRNALKSAIARAFLNAVSLVREFEKDLGLILGRVGKTHYAPEEMCKDIGRRAH